MIVVACYWKVFVWWIYIAQFLSWFFFFFFVCNWFPLYFTLSICLNEALMLTRTSAACYLCKLVSVFLSKWRWLNFWGQTQTKFAIWNPTSIIYLSLIYSIIYWTVWKLMQNNECCQNIFLYLKWRRKVELNGDLNQRYKPSKTTKH